MPAPYRLSSSPRVMLVDPSLFTPAYDNALSEGLEDNAVRPVWMTRQRRPDEEPELVSGEVVPAFYRHTDRWTRRRRGIMLFAKGFEHYLGLRRMIRRARRGEVDIVHFQWLVLPILDRWAIGKIRRYRPVVLTLHDTTPFNGKAVNLFQKLGFFRVISAVDHLIVHTEKGREMLSSRLEEDKVSVVPHGILKLKREPDIEGAPRHHRWRIIQFGRIQDYKGVDVLIEALGLMSAEERDRISVVVAGEPFVDTGKLQARARELGLSEDVLEFRFARLSEEEMTELLQSGDAFVFPYRAIESSGVLFLVAPYKRWIIASDIGAFSDVVGRDEASGTLIPADDARILASALVASIGRRPVRDISSSVPSWGEIGKMTLEVYDRAAEHWDATQPGKSV